jgi:hypothetical protein
MTADTAVGLAGTPGRFQTGGIGREYGRRGPEEFFELQSLGL